MTSLPTRTARTALGLLLVLVLGACTGEDLGSNSIAPDPDGGFEERSEGEQANDGEVQSEGGRPAEAPTAP